MSTRWSSLSLCSSRFPLNILSGLYQTSGWVRIFGFTLDIQILFMKHSFLFFSGENQTLIYTTAQWYAIKTLSNAPGRNSFVRLNFERASDSSWTHSKRQCRTLFATWFKGRFCFPVLQSKRAISKDISCGLNFSVVHILSSFVVDKKICYNVTNVRHLYFVNYNDECLCMLIFDRVWSRTQKKKGYFRKTLKSNDIYLYVVDCWICSFRFRNSVASFIPSFDFTWEEPSAHGTSRFTTFASFCAEKSCIWRSIQGQVPLLQSHTDTR